MVKKVTEKDLGEHLGSAYWPIPGISVRTYERGMGIKCNGQPRIFVDKMGMETLLDSIDFHLKSKRCIKEI